MSDDRFFCASESRANSEAVFGTVARIQSWLLLEYPSVWRRRAIQDSRLLSDGVKKHIAALERRGEIDRSLLIRREHRRSGVLRCFHVASCETAPRIRTTLLDDYDHLPDLQLTRGEAVDGLMFAVCTHGRHDKCCAKFGLPVLCEFREKAGDRAWECSHVGGDRFAANVVVFPYGIYYGRVRPEDVAEIVRRSELGQIWLPGYRGRSCFTRPTQIAEYFARVESGRLGIDEFRPKELCQTVGGNTRVQLFAKSDDTVHEVEFSTETDALHQRLTCHATEPSPVPQYRLRRYELIES
jgi:hypothetical protein